MHTTSSAAPGLAPRAAQRRWRPWLEWAFWIALAAAAYSQIGFFDEPIQNYDFGAAGWPRVLCAMMALGATGQLLYQLLVPPEAAGRPADAASPAPAAGGGPVPATTLRKLAIFVLPFAYVWAAPKIGFFVATTVFVVALLLLLEVRRVKPLATVTAIVLGLLLLVFTRFFYVALPLGQWDGFFEVNAWIVDLARWGM